MNTESMGMKSDNTTSPAPSPYEHRNENFTDDMIIKGLPSLVGQVIEIRAHEIGTQTCLLTGTLESDGNGGYKITGMPFYKAGEKGPKTPVTVNFQGADIYVPRLKGNVSRNLGESLLQKRDR